MPLLFVKDVAPNVKLGVWSIKENVDEFFSGNACLEAMRDEISSLFSSMQASRKSFAKFDDST